MCTGNTGTATGLVVNAMFTLPGQQESQISSVLPAREPQMPMSNQYWQPGLCPSQKSSVHVYLCIGVSANIVDVIVTFMV